VADGRITAVSTLAGVWVTSSSAAGVTVVELCVIEVQATRVIDSKINRETTREDLLGIPHPPA